MTIDPAREWLTVPEACRITGRARDVVYAALRSGQLVGTKRTPYAHWRIHRADLDAWMRGGPTEVAA